MLHINTVSPIDYVDTLFVNITGEPDFVEYHVFGEANVQLQGRSVSGSGFVFVDDELPRIKVEIKKPEGIVGGLELGMTPKLPNRVDGFYIKDNPEFDVFDGNGDITESSQDIVDIETGLRNEAFKIQNLTQVLSTAIESERPLTIDERLAFSLVNQYGEYLSVLDLSSDQPGGPGIYTVSPLSNPDSVKTILDWYLENTSEWSCDGLAIDISS